MLIQIHILLAHWQCDLAICTHNPTQAKICFTKGHISSSNKSRLEQLLLRGYKYMSSWFFKVIWFACSKCIIYFGRGCPFLEGGCQKPTNRNNFHFYIQNSSILNILRYCRRLRNQGSLQIINSNNIVLDLLIMILVKFDRLAGKSLRWPIFDPIIWSISLLNSITVITALRVTIHSFRYCPKPIKHSQNATVGLDQKDL